MSAGATYDFGTQLVAGLADEAALAEALNATPLWAVGGPLPGRVYQSEVGMDRFVRHLGARYTAEFKVDSRMAHTHNLFVETVSVRRNGDTDTDGWALRSGAQILFYWAKTGMRSGFVLVCDMCRIKAHVADWVAAYGEKTIPNAGYTTHGACVPGAELRKAGALLYIYEMAAGRIDLPAAWTRPDLRAPAALEAAS